ncbi:MAG: hypothetical protein A3E01_07875 [Gammaproteobacteria bacterium RIFCSPHIGHO2_12_FULL_63_22]|nr:MAG: hypothetical protein A3E01_07875 [Gammaproteobacteria bacterium RIFCSPHIGHO2_12_FULL_63_22]
MKRVLLGAAYSVIEPLGLLHLAGLARDLGWERKIALVKDHDFEPFFSVMRDYRPDLIGFNVYTGNHLQAFEAFRKIRKDFPGTRLVLGGPHATYFPMDAVAVVDDVVMSEGFGAFRAILAGGKPGIFPLRKIERFPMPDRETFYADYPEHGRSKIKSAITMTGCPYTCLLGDTFVNTIYGKIPIKELAEKYGTIPVYTYDREEGRAFIADAVNIRRTGRNKKLVRVTFDDGTHIDCTPDHRFLAFGWGNQNGPSWETETEAKDLQSKMHVRALREEIAGAGYTSVTWSRRGRQLRSRMVVEYMKGRRLLRTEQVHHKDRNRLNDHPDNLEYCASVQEHHDRHPEIAQRMREDNPSRRMTPEQRARSSERAIARFRGRKQSLEERLKHRDHQLGENNSNYKHGKTVGTRSRIKEVNHVVVSVVALEETADVYCMEVPATGWFYANDVLVHNCLYCYNSTVPEDIKDGLPPEIYAEIANTKGMGGRLFPKNVRSVDDVVAEGREIAERWPETRIIYFQDDVHGFDVKPGGWMEKLADRWPSEVGVPYHAQMRWEMVNPKTEGRRRLDLVQRAGCTGLTLAIEAADPAVRMEVLDRAMPDSLMFDGMAELAKRGLKVRTEQITALPYGATAKPTKMNLDADLELVELNVRLRRETGLPTMAWGSTLAPYKRTGIGTYCEKFGHYTGMNNDVPDTFFDRSVLRFPREWIGHALAERKDDPGVWLDAAALDRYRDQNAELRRIFNFVTLVPDGHVLARSYLLSNEPYTFGRLGRETEAHLWKLRDPEAGPLLAVARRLTTWIAEAEPGGSALVPVLLELVPLFACLPKSLAVVERFAAYAVKDGPTPMALSTAVRHHLYDSVLYAVEDERAQVLK